MATTNRRKPSPAEALDDARAAALDAFITRQMKMGDLAGHGFLSGDQDLPTISTGAVGLDLALGIGGIPRGRITEIYGPDSAGKTSLALSTCACATRAGGVVGYVDADRAISPEHVRGMGVDPSYCALAQPTSGEEALALVEDMVKAGVFDVVVVDSVAALVPQSELDGPIGAANAGEQDRMMSAGLRRLVSVVAESTTALIFINQLRDRVGVLPGAAETTTGGSALKFYASVRLDVRAPAGNRVMDPRDPKTQIGIACAVKVVKNKAAPPLRVAEYDLIWGKGIAPHRP